MEESQIPVSLKDGSAFGQQYAGVYFTRLCLLRRYVTQALSQMQSDAQLVPRIGAVADQKCMVVGTVCKGAKVSSEAVRQYFSELNLDVDLKDWRRPSDLIMLEDESARLSLVLSDMVDLEVPLVTGMVVGVIGQLNAAGDMAVDTIVHPIPLIPPPVDETSKPQTIAFISGLHFGKSDLRLLMRLRDLLSELKKAGLTKIVIAGDTIDTADVSLDSLKLLDQADSFLASLAGLAEVDLMPGAADPTLRALPQPPIHGALLPRADLFETFHEVGNPHTFVHQGVRFLGSSGQPVDNIVLNASCSEIDALKATLISRCIAPTAPDSLPCHSTLPDSMVLDSDANAPHVLFTGCASVFASNEVNGVTLLTVPSYSKTSSVVLMEVPSRRVKLVRLDQA